MAKAGRKVENAEMLAEHFYRRLREGLFILMSFLAVFVAIAVATYHNTDPSWSGLVQTDLVENAAGRAGAWIADIVLYVFGYFAYILPMVMSLLMWRWSRADSVDEEQPYHYRLLAMKIAGVILLFCGFQGMASLHIHAHINWLPFTAGGVIGNLVGFQLAKLFNVLGTTLLLLSAILLGITLCTGLSWLGIADLIGAKVLAAWDLLGSPWQKLSSRLSYRATRTSEKPERNTKTKTVRQDPEINLQQDGASNRARNEPKIIPPSFEDAESPPLIHRAPAKPVVVSNPRQETMSFDVALAGTLPPLELLDTPDLKARKGYTNQQLEEMSRLVEMRLQDFGVVVKVVAVQPGPVVTRYELQPAPGTKASKITGLSRDLARALSVTSVFVVEVIPGKTVIGLELPNESREMVRLREILSSQRFTQSKSPLTMGLGKDISGHAVVVDLAKMPHLLVAGTTGSGKSVGLNAMLLSLLYKATPKQLRMIMIDPKMLELAIYDGIPHLLTPVVTDMKDAANALRWCVAEMERRYKLMASLGVRNITGYNQKVKDATDAGDPIYDPLWQPRGEDATPQYLDELPYIVVLADEFADMIMVVGKKVEELITRIAQKARAAGIHLILATQRPSVDVITGLIKANIPTRIAFQVSSRIDSRTILDQSGAEQLLGHGDMLYLPPGTAVPVRVHGAYVADEEVHRVVSDLKRRGKAEYLEDVISTKNDPSENVEGNSGDGDDGEQDPLYDQAVEIVVQSRRASISSVQRRLKIGFNRAARLIETMESAGIVGPMENGSREVLVEAVESD